MCSYFPFCSIYPSAHLTLFFLIIVFHTVIYPILFHVVVILSGPFLFDLILLNWFRISLHSYTIANPQSFMFFFVLFVSKECKTKTKGLIKIETPSSNEKQGLISKNMRNTWLFVRSFVLFFCFCCVKKEPFSILRPKLKT